MNHDGGGDHIPQGHPHSISHHNTLTNHVVSSHTPLPAFSSKAHHLPAWRKVKAIATCSSPNVTMTRKVNFTPMIMSSMWGHRTTPSSTPSTSAGLLFLRHWGPRLLVTSRLNLTVPRRSQCDAIVIYYPPMWLPHATTPADIHYSRTTVLSDLFSTLSLFTRIAISSHPLSNHSRFYLVHLQLDSSHFF